jgi:hypothetical protein
MNNSHGATMSLFSATGTLRRGRPNPLKFGIALSASAPSRIDNHLNELCNLIAREIA